jgi:hypothetical protein
MKGRGAMNRQTSTRAGRRRLLQALGLGAGALYLPSLMGDRNAYAAPPPKRLVVFLTDHGPVTGRWQMRRPGLPETSADWEFPLDDPDPMSFSETLRPLHPYRDDLLIVDGLSMTSAYADPAFGGNGHASSVPNRLAAQGGGSGGSIDQIIAGAVGASTAFQYLFYINGSCDCWDGSPIFDTAGNQVSPGRLGGYSFLPDAFDRVFGGLPDPGEGPPPGPPTPAELSALRRKSTLELVGGEYQKLLDKLGADDREKLKRHRDMILDLEAKIDTLSQIECEKPTYPADGLPDNDVVDITLTQLYPLAMACDLTRVAVLGVGQLAASDIGAPSTIDVHQDAAHPSENDPAASWMTSYYAFHAAQFGKLIEAFRSVPEGNGTMLDNSLLLWMPELANGWHDLYRIMVVMAGGAGGSFATGRYLKYKEVGSSPEPGYDVTLGPPHSKLLVSILQAFGVDQNSIGVTSAQAKDGSTIDLTGPLDGLS